jgi:branched-chain amino acid transport system permease protein
MTTLSTPRVGIAAVLLRTVLPVLCVLLLALFMQAVIKPSISPFQAKVLTGIAINIVLAVSLNIVNGFTGQFSMGHAGFMAVGGYTGAAVTYYGSFRIWGDSQWRGGWASWAFDPSRFTGSLIAPGDLLFLMACIAAGLVAAFVGWVVALPSLRLRGDYLAIVTLGFGEIVRVLLTQSSDVLTDPAQIRDTPLPSLFTHLGGALGFTSAAGIPTYTTQFWAFLWVGVTVLVALRLKFSSPGRALLAIREDEIAAEAMGVPTTRYKVRAFVISSFLAGVAGCLFAHELGTTLNPRELGFQKSFDVIIMVVLGGMGSVSGAILAATILTILPELLRAFSQYRMIVYALALVLMMILRPQGLLGLREIWEIGPLGPWLRRRAST